MFSSHTFNFILQITLLTGLFLAHLAQLLILVLKLLGEGVLLVLQGGDSPFLAGDLPSQLLYFTDEFLALLIELVQLLVHLRRRHVLHLV